MLSERAQHVLLFVMYLIVMTLILGSLALVVPSRMRFQSTGVVALGIIWFLTDFLMEQQEWLGRRRYGSGATSRVKRALWVVDLVLWMLGAGAVGMLYSRVEGLLHQLGWEGPAKSSTWPLVATLCVVLPVFLSLRGGLRRVIVRTREPKR